MTINWSELQRGSVDEILKRHHVHSGQCNRAAIAILPIAREVDPEAETYSIRPRDKRRNMAPKVSLRGSRWWVHFTVRVTEHCVDALTGPDGTAAASYLATYFDHPGEHVLAPEEPPDEP